MSARLIATFPHESQLRGTTRRPPARSIALAVLVGLTSLAIGRAFSWWLVPGYLVLMSWLLASPRPAHESETGAAGLEGLPPDSLATDEPREDHCDDSPPAPDATETLPRSRKRSRKPKPKPKPVPDPPEAAVWIKVGPGQFVRAEAPASTAEPPPAPPEDTPTAPESVVPPQPRRRRAIRIESSIPPRARRHPDRVLSDHRPTRWRAARLAIA